MNVIFDAMFPEMLLCALACVLFLLGTSTRPAIRKLCAMIALAGLLVVLLMQRADDNSGVLRDSTGAVVLGLMGVFIKALGAFVGMLLVLLAWPNSQEGDGGASISFGQDTGEFFGLMLLSLAGLFIVATANDIMLLFLGIELASIPTYVMVSMSRPLPVAQEAGVKYFFLGAMSAAVLLFGFSYLYGTTGSTNLSVIALKLSSTGTLDSAPILTTWQKLAFVLVIAGLAFKMAAAPLHVYVGDVYQGAATPVTALLAFVPKTTGFVALLKILSTASGSSHTWLVSPSLATLIAVLAALTMFAGNMLALMQHNVKRVLAYSSVAHTGYMLVGVAALVASGSSLYATESLSGILFYLTAYGVMNIGAFGVLMLLPSLDRAPATTAETFDDLAGKGRRHVALGLAMAVACFSLTGLPLTVGFFGKFMLIKPALHAGLTWLVVLMLINAAISAGYYLRIVAVMFLRPEVEGTDARTPALPITTVLAVLVSVVITLGLGTIVPVTQALSTRTEQVAGAPGLLSPVGLSASTPSALTGR